MFIKHFLQTIKEKIFSFLKTSQVNYLQADLYNTQIIQRQLLFHYQYLKKKRLPLPNFQDTGFRGEELIILKKIKESVIIPAYNCRKSLRRTISSLNKLSYPKHRWEIVVVANNSNDGTMDMVNEIKSQIKVNIKYVKESRLSFIALSGILPKDIGELLKMLP